MSSLPEEDLAGETGTRVQWDMLILLVITQPREGWEREWEAVTRRLIEHIAPLPPSDVPSE